MHDPFAGFARLVTEAPGRVEIDDDGRAGVHHQATVREPDLEAALRAARALQLAVRGHARGQRGAGRREDAPILQPHVCVVEHDAHLEVLAGRYDRLIHHVEQLAAGQLEQLDEIRGQRRQLDALFSAGLRIADQNEAIDLDEGLREIARRVGQLDGEPGLVAAHLAVGSTERIGVLARGDRQGSHDRGQNSCPSHVVIPRRWGHYYRPLPGPRQPQQDGRGMACISLRRGRGPAEWVASRGWVEPSCPRSPGRSRAGRRCHVPREWSPDAGSRPDRCR